MTKLYIANCMKQTYIFAYRVPNESGIKQLPIRIGEQIQLPGDFDMSQISNTSASGIVDQHLKYGMVKFDEIDRTKPFIGICYSVDKKIPVEKIMRAMTHNEMVLEQRGRDLRQASAVASNNLIEKHLHEANQQSGGDAELGGFEMTVEEESQRGGRNGNDDLMKEGIKVDKAAEKNTEVKYEQRPRQSRKRSG